MFLYLIIGASLWCGPCQYRALCSPRLWCGTAAHVGLVQLPCLASPACQATEWILMPNNVCPAQRNHRKDFAKTNSSTHCEVIPPLTAKAGNSYQYSVEDPTSPQTPPQLIQSESLSLCDMNSSMGPHSYEKLDHRALDWWWQHANQSEQRIQQGYTVCFIRESLWHC